MPAIFKGLDKSSIRNLETKVRFLADLISTFFLEGLDQYLIPNL